MDTNTQALLELLFRGGALLLIIVGVVFLYMGFKGRVEKRKSNIIIAIVLIVISVILFIIGNAMGA